MYFNPPQPGNNPANPFWHPLNQNLSEENRLTGMDQDEALKIYNRLKKGSEIEVQFGNAISSGGRPITLRVTSGHRIVGKSRVGRIILVNPENPRGMKYKLFNRDGRISLAQSDMATILKSMKILKEDVQLDEMKKSDGPFTVVALKNNKVVGQLRNVEHYDIEVAIKMMEREHQGARISVESKKGKVVHTEEVEQVDESSLPAYDARLLRQALVLGKNAFKAGKKRQPLKDKNLVSLRGFAKGKGKNEVMKQWLRGWDEENLKEDVQLDESNVYNPPKDSSAYYGTGSKKLGFGSFAIVDRFGSIIRVGLSEKQARRLVQPGQKVDNLPGAKVGQVLKKNNVPDFYREDVQVNEEKSLFDISPTSSKWMKGRLKIGYNQPQKSGMPKEVFKKGQVIDLHPFDGERFVGAKSPKDKGSYFFVAKRNVDAMNESVQLGESFEFQFPTKKIAQNFMREISQEGLGSSTGTSDGQVTTTTHSGRVGEPTMAHMKMARIMKRYSGKLVRTTEGPRMAKIFEATTPLRKKVAAAKAKLKKAGITSAFQFGELYVHDKDLKKAMSIIGGDRDLLLVGQPMPLTKDDLMDGI